MHLRTMEASMFDDSFPSNNREKITTLKRNMRLEFSGPPTKKMRVGGSNCLLSSPDLNMLKLGSPELEKLIITGNGLVTTTPTPNQGQPLIFPRTVTEEQEIYARGFVEALNELHGVGEPRIVTLGDPNELTAPPPHHPQQQQQQQQTPPYLYNHNLDIKEEPQTVPSVGVSPPMSPIDMMAQEKIKLERKRQRNRIAASKCRRRKLERIARLEDKVKLLKQENTDLANVASKLRDSVCGLKQQIMEHASSGCQVLPQSQFDGTFGDE